VIARSLGSVSVNLLFFVAHLAHTVSLSVSNSSSPFGNVKSQAGKILFGADEPAHPRWSASLDVRSVVPVRRARDFETRNQIMCLE
jgi:hypothetical protein